MGCLWTMAGGCSVSMNIHLRKLVAEGIEALPW
jgi:hypothetical protein